MAVFQETPQAGWEEEASFNAVGKTPVAAAPDNKSEGPKQRNQSIPRKRNGSLLGWLLSSSESQAGEFTLMHTGWVAKQGHFVANWKNRFLRLVIDNRSLPRTATLAYYKSADLGECAMRSGQQGSIQLADATIIRCEYSMKDSTTIAPRLWGFKITTPEGKVYPFRAESAADREEWLLKLQEAAAACK